MTLERYARRTKVGKRSKVIRTRIPEDLYERFKTHCNRLGLTISEAVFLLIKDEVDRPSHEIATAIAHENYNVATSVGQMTTPRPRRSSKNEEGRFTTIPYVVNGRLPCPICGTWPEKQKNISRHMREVHNSTTEEVYKAHMETIKRMVAEARGEKAEGPGA